MSSGLPVITTDDPGYDIYRLDRSLIRLITPSSDGVRAALVELAGDAELRGRMSEYSIKYAQENFKWTTHVENLAIVLLRGKWMTTRHIAVSVLRTLRLYSTLGVLYIALNSVTHPTTLNLHLTHFASWPSEGTFGLACLTVSVISTLLLKSTEA